MRLAAAAHHEKDLWPPALVNKRAAGKADNSPGLRPSKTTHQHPTSVPGEIIWELCNKSFSFLPLVSKNSKHVLEHMTSVADPGPSSPLPAEGVPAQLTESLSTRALTASTRAVSRSNRPMTCAIFCRRTSAGILSPGNGEAGPSSLSAPARLFCSPSA